MDNVKLVSKDFYERCSTIFNKEWHRLVINIPKLDDPTIINAMKFSLRRFSALEIIFDDFTPEHIEKTCELLEIFGTSVKFLNLFGLPGQDRIVKQSLLIQWLNLMPNIRIIKEGQFTESILDDDETSLNLAHLREVRFCSMALGLKLHLISPSLLVSLEVSGVLLPNLPQIFERHRGTLKKLSFDDISGYKDSVPFRQLQLHSFKCYYSQEVDIQPHEEFLFNALMHQNQLKVLKIDEILAESSFQISPRILRDICKKTELEKLTVHFSEEITAADVNDMRNLKKLQELEINMFTEDEQRNETMLQTFCCSSLLEITSIHFNYYINRLSLNMFLDSFPKLKYLFLRCENYSFCPGRTYRNMVELWLSGTAIDLMPCFIKSCPNLQEIYFESLYPRVSTVRQILKSQVTELDLTIRLIDGLSPFKERKLRKISEKFMDKFKRKNLLVPISFRATGE